MPFFISNSWRDERWEVGDAPAVAGVGFAPCVGGGGDGLGSEVVEGGHIFLNWTSMVFILHREAYIDVTLTAIEPKVVYHIEEASLVGWHTVSRRVGVIPEIEERDDKED